MDCSEIREQFLRDHKAPTGPLVDAHIRECASCAALSANGGALAGSLATPGAANVDVEAIFRSLSGELEAERGVVAWLRSRPTWARRTLLVVAALPVAAGILSSGPRRDLGDYSQARMAAIIAVLFGASIWLLGVGTRPLQRPQLSRGASIVAALLGVAVGFAIALLPVAHPESVGAPATLHCYVSGLAIGLPVLLVAILLRRHGSLGGALLFAAGAGLTSNLVIQLACSAVDRGHLVLGHATVGLTFAAVVLAGGALARIFQKDA